MIRHHLTQADEAIPQWQTIYCSLMLLLVVFFVMLMVYSAIDKERLERISHITPTPAETIHPGPPLSEAMQSLKQLSVVLGEEAPLAITRTADGFKAVIPDPILFDSGAASLNAAIYPLLDGIIAIAKQNQLLIQIEGHTDNIPIKTTAFPSFSSNWELSTMRAVNILRYLQTAGGIAPDRLMAVGFAEFHPLADNGTAEGRKANRRIEIVFRADQ